MKKNVKIIKDEREVICTLSEMRNDIIDDLKKFIKYYEKHINFESKELSNELKNSSDNLIKIITKIKESYQYGDNE